MATLSGKCYKGRQYWFDPVGGVFEYIKWFVCRDLSDAERPAEAERCLTEVSLSLRFRTHLSTHGMSC